MPGLSRSQIDSSLQEILNAIAASGETSIPQAWMERLPNDFRTRAQLNGNLMIANKQSVPMFDSTSLLNDLRTGGRTTLGAMYELMSASELTERPAKACGFDGATRSIEIRDGDWVSMGDRVPASIRKDGLGKTISRRSVEADTTIYSDRGPIGIDQKFRSNERFDGNRDFRAQLDGVQNAILRGHYKEFHFITNGKIGAPTKAIIQDADREVRATIGSIQERVNKIGLNDMAFTDLELLSIDTSKPVIGSCDEYSI